MYHPCKPKKPIDDYGVVRHGKLQPRLVPAVLLEITIGPAGAWGSCYGVIPLAIFTGARRPSRAALRRTMDVTFPDEIPFPLRQRLALHGAVADRALPVPAIAEDTWDLCAFKRVGGERPEVHGRRALGTDLGP